MKAVESVQKNCRIHIIMSQWAMMGEGLLVIAAAKAALTGAGLDEIIQLTERNDSRLGMRIAFDTLEYLKRGGRIGKAKALLGAMLRINPILGIKDGEVFPFGQERSRNRAMQHLYNFVTSYSHIKSMAVEDAITPDEADALVERIRGVFPDVPIYRSKVSPVIGTNVGPSVIGVAVLGDK